MNIHSLKMLGLLASVAALGTLTAQAQDKATLDLLVKKGVISQADADGVAKSSSTVGVVAHDPNVKKLTLEGDLQIQMDMMTTNDKGNGNSNPTSNNEFMIRRAHIGAIADLGNGWGGELLMDMAAGAQVPGAPQAGLGDAWNLFEKAIITKKIDEASGTLTVGYTKVMFGLEETTSANAVKPIERSLGSRYFDETYKGETSRIGFANHHVGIFWDGKIDQVDGLTYGVAFTNGAQSSEQYTNAGGFNKFAYWFYGAYANKVGDVSYKTGVNFGYSSEGNSNAVAGTPNQANSVYAYNPYLTLHYGNFDLASEFEQAMVTNGRANAAGTVSSRANPIAFSLTPSYMITPQWEVVFRYSYLNTDGRGAAISDVVRDGHSPSVGGTLFNDAQQYYLGLNWYIMGNSLKWSVGYEYSVFNNRGTNMNNLTGPRAEVDGFRTRLQITF